MSRALDPQLHTHVVAANLARGGDGRFTALHGAPLYRAAKTAGFLYQSHLRALVSERLGLRWGEVHKGAAELEGVKRPVVEHFSKRREEMLREAEEGGIGLEHEGRGGERGARHARPQAVRDRDPHLARGGPLARRRSSGSAQRSSTELFREGCERPVGGLIERDEAAEQSLGDHLAGPEGLTAHSNTFDERAVLQEFAASATQGALVSEVRGRAERFAERPDVIANARMVR